MNGNNVMRVLGLMAAWALGLSSAKAADGTPPSMDMTKPVQVFILLGQSNMLGMGKISSQSRGKHRGPEGSLEAAVKVKKKYPYLVDEAGNWLTRRDGRYVRVSLHYCPYGSAYVLPLFRRG